MAHRHAVLGFLLGILLAIVLSACQSPSKVGLTRNPQVRGDPAAYAQEKARLEKAVSLADAPQDKAQAHLELGFLHLDCGEAREALRSFYEARRVFHTGSIANLTNRALGLAYFDLAGYALARRYLEKGIQGCDAQEREVVLAKLTVCCRALEDTEGATRYRSRLTQPYSQEVKQILATVPRQHDGAQLGEDPMVAGLLEDSDYQHPGSAEEHPLSHPPDAADNERLYVLSREIWNASSVRTNVDPMGPISRITVHHTGGRDFWGASRSEAATEIRSIQRYHQNERGWADIGYHYIVDRQGNVWQGRRLRHQGAHARGPMNYGNIGIAVLGNFCHQKPTRAQYLSLSLLLEKLCHHFHMSPQQVYTHGELASGRTSCPGPALARCVEAIRSHLYLRLVAYRTSSDGAVK